MNSNREEKFMHALIWIPTIRKSTHLYIDQALMTIRVYAVKDMCTVTVLRFQESHQDKFYLFWKIIGF